MPYLDATPAALQRMFGIADTDLPDAALVVGQWGQGPYFEHVRSIWPDARDIEEHSILIDAGGRRIWVSVVFGAAMAATVAHFAVKLGARALIQTGSMGGLAPGWNVGDVLVLHSSSDATGWRDNCLETNPSSQVAIYQVISRPNSRTGCKRRPCDAGRSSARRRSPSSVDQEVVSASAYSRDSTLATARVAAMG